MVRLKRRRFIAAVMGAGFIKAEVEAQTTTTPSEIAASGPKPVTGGGKFYPTGQVREWPGNTIICPVEPDTVLHDILKHVQEAAMAEPVMRKFTFLPTSSLHMTLFEGVDIDHRRPPYWPRSIPTDAPLSAVHQWCANRLQDFRTGGGRFVMTPDLPAPTPNIRDFSLRLLPATTQEEQHLRDLRDRLSSSLQIRAPNHAAYRFHITLGYLIDALSAEETAHIYQLYKIWFAQIAAAAPAFVIGPPIFCTFRDMFAFTPLLTLTD